ncbi:lysylphosphatidylglycerol synthase domain-containing protein [Nocardioides guangzhouensis]|nr:lysylphosphatidylglycerol synthase domain-containing protein [Nocardioides guangzhouensis]
MAAEMPSRPRGIGPVMLTDYEAGRRNRRAIDAVLLGVMALLTGLAATIANSAPNQDQAVGQALVTILGWAPSMWRAAVLCALALAAVVLVVITVRGRWALLRDVALALVALAGTGSVVGRIVGPDWLAVDNDLWSRWGFPEYRLAAAIAIVTVVGPELVRPVRALFALLVVAAGVGQLALAAALPSDVLGAVALGLGAGALVRLVFGSAAGVPPSADVRDSMLDVGVELDDLRPVAPQEMGSAVYAGYDREGHAVRVRVLGRDAQDTQRFARRWRLLAYRDPRRSAPIGRLEQVEHEALAILMAAKAGVRVPEVVIAALGRGGDAAVVTRQADVDPLELVSPSEVRDATLVELWRQVARMHAAGISHGRLNASRVILDHEGQPVIVGLAAATLGAPQPALDIDVAELLVSSTVLVGPHRALSAAVRGSGVDTVKGSLPFLQRAALTPHTREFARSHEVALEELRTSAAEAAGTVPVEIAPMTRIRPRNLLLTAAIAVSAYLLIAQLADIGFTTIGDYVRTAQPVWLLTGLVLATLGFVPQAISLRGAVATPLPLLPCVVFESALKFVNLTVPGAAGTLAATVRFVQRLGGTAAEAVASGAVSNVAGKLVKILLALLMLPFVRDGLGNLHLHVGTPDSKLVSAILTAIVFSGLVIWLVPAVNTKIIPPLREGFAALRVVLRDRRKRLELFGGKLAGELTFALCLGAVCHAYGVGLSIAELLAINVAASVLAAFIPVPGGVGAAEATLTALLIAFGVDDSTAFAIAISQRLCTHYLPPIWGAFSLRWLRKRGFV